MLTKLIYFFKQYLKIFFSSILKKTKNYLPLSKVNEQRQYSFFSHAVFFYLWVVYPYVNGSAGFSCLWFQMWLGSAIRGQLRHCRPRWWSSSYQTYDRPHPNRPLDCQQQTYGDAPRSGPSHHRVGAHKYLLSLWCRRQYIGSDWYAFYTYGY